MTDVLWRHFSFFLGVFPWILTLMIIRYLSDPFSNYDFANHLRILFHILRYFVFLQKWIIFSDLGYVNSVLLSLLSPTLSWGILLNLGFGTESSSLTLTFCALHFSRLVIKRIWWKYHMKKYHMLPISKNSKNSLLQWIMKSGDIQNAHFQMVLYDRGIFTAVSFAKLKLIFSYGILFSCFSRSILKNNEPSLLGSISICSVTWVSRWILSCKVLWLFRFLETILFMILLLDVTFTIFQNMFLRGNKIDCHLNDYRWSLSLLWYKRFKAFSMKVRAIFLQKW